MKPILFIDFDGTLCFDRFWRSLDASSYQTVQDFLFANKPLINDWMRGRHTAEDINILLAKELRLPYAELWDVFVRDCQQMSVHTSILLTIKNLNDRYTTILITDNMDSFTRFTAPALHLESYFNQIVNSFDYKKLKEDDDGQLFLATAQQHNAIMRDGTLIDNSPSACDLFTRLGGHSCLVTPEHDTLFWLKKIANQPPSTVV